jgi:hypothetical protein
MPKLPKTNPNFNIDDVNIQNALFPIKNALKKKLVLKSKYNAAINEIIASAAKNDDPIKFLNTQLKLLDPTAKVWNATKPVKPGEFYGLPTPNIPLSPAALKHVPNPDNIAKADALTKKIKAYEDEIERLKKAQAGALLAAEKAKSQKELLSSNIDEKLLKYFTYIEQNCSQFLTSVAASGKFLFRGQADALLPVFVANPRPDRKPKDSNPAAQELFDNYLTIMGFKALRSNSIFTTSNYGQALQYGIVYAIFPKNGFDFSWSTEHDDLIIKHVSDIEPEDSNASTLYYNVTDTALLDFTSIGEFLINNCNIDESDPKFKVEHNKLAKSPIVKTLIKEIHNWGTTIPEDNTYAVIANQLLKIVSTYETALTSHPILKKCLTATDYKYLNKLIVKVKKQLTSIQDDTLLRSNAPKVIKNYGYTNKDMTSALKSTHEICVKGEYVAVDYNRYQNELKQYFLTSIPKVSKKPAGKPAPNASKPSSKKKM